MIHKTWIVPDNTLEYSEFSYVCVGIEYKYVPLSDVMIHETEGQKNHKQVQIRTRTITCTRRQVS